MCHRYEPCTTPQATEDASRLLNKTNCEYVSIASGSNNQEGDDDSVLAQAVAASFEEVSHNDGRSTAELVASLQQESPVV